jgi:hypothetical protein
MTHRSTSQPLIKNFLNVLSFEDYTLYSTINIIKMAPPNRLICSVFRKDYKHIDNPPLKSYLTDDSINNSLTNNPVVDANFNAVNANTAIKPAIDPALTDASPFKATNDLIQDNDFDNNSLTVFDLVLQTLSTQYLRRT